MTAPEEGTANSQSGFVAQVRLAASFLTILPVGASHADNAVVAASFRWFPLVGFALGATLAVEDKLLRVLFPPMLCAGIVVLSLIIVTGAVHLDALADTVDAFGAGADRDRALKILRDSHIGTFGACAIALSLALKIIALASITVAGGYLALMVAAGLARWSMVAVAYGLEYLRAEGGAGATLLQRDPSGLAVASLSTGVVLLLVFSARAIDGAAVAVALTLATRWFYRRWLGGVTGDLIGACGELVEVAVLITFAASVA